ncbi:MAG: hypothetical protein LBB59_00190 [Campylobacteraceae bacterium]|jgi:hypothetical protein|nr:hypothetical protein [Campylobacteraceae bacterium]
MRQIYEFISLLLSIVANLFFYAPITYYMFKGRSEESGIIEFTNFIFSYDIFYIHAAAVTIAFTAFLLAVFALFGKMTYRAAAALVISLAVIIPYLAGLEKIFILM